jgi:ankyrin repeat protein
MGAAVEDSDASRAGELLTEVDASLIDTLGPEGDTLLHVACVYGHEDCVRLLLQHNASTSIVDEDNGTVLHDAAASGYDSSQLLFCACTTEVLYMPYLLPQLCKGSTTRTKSKLHHSECREASHSDCKLLEARNN